MWHSAKTNPPNPGETVLLATVVNQKTLAIKYTLGCLHFKRIREVGVHSATTLRYCDENGVDCQPLCWANPLQWLRCQFTNQLPMLGQHIVIMGDFGGTAAVLGRVVEIDRIHSVNRINSHSKNTKLTLINDANNETEFRVQQCFGTLSGYWAKVPDLRKETIIRFLELVKD